MRTFEPAYGSPVDAWPIRSPSHDFDAHLRELLNRELPAAIARLESGESLVEIGD